MNMLKWHYMFYAWKFVIKKDPEGKFVYTNVMISKEQNMLLTIYRAYFPSGKFGSFASSTVYQKPEIEYLSKSYWLGNLFILANYVHIIQINSPSIYTFIILFYK